MTTITQSITSTLTTSTLSNTPSFLATICAITFKGNASNNLQQDAFVINGQWHQADLGITPEIATDAFCVAVADGLAMSRHSGHVSRAVVRSIAEQWQQYASWEEMQSVSLDKIHHTVNALPQKYVGAGSTLAMVRRYGACQDTVTVTHIGDSRVYLYRANAQVNNDTQADTHNQVSSMTGWQCLTYDHNVLNQLVRERAQEAGIDPDPSEFNREGMAGSLYAITECLMHEGGGYLEDDPLPTAEHQTLKVQAGDAMLICTDRIHDLVAHQHWQPITASTDLHDWLKTLRQQVYASEGKAYDNGTAIVIRFG